MNCPLRRRRNKPDCVVHTKTPSNVNMTTHLCETCGVLDVVWGARPATETAKMHPRERKRKRAVERYYF